MQQLILVMFLAVLHAHVECVAPCPKLAWMRDPGWPHAPTIEDAPAIGMRFSYLPSSGKDGTIEYLGRNEWRSV
jgi:hypothetical protein